jgi:hypothetical protein|tara:strand:- start:1477 stop:1974 length:498 start_codon:yes stop_codon:yes gene_type:complete
MKKQAAPFILFTLLFSILGGCEKDDVCLVETPSTPRLIIKLFDKDDRSLSKAADNIKIYGIGKENPLITLTTDSLVLPLKTQDAFTQYAFLLPTSTASLTVGDTLQFNYRRYDQYLNRSCGYRANFILDKNTVSYPNAAPIWMDSFEILIDTVSNEQQTHLAIYH